MAFDAHKNFAVSLVATAPSPATSGTSLVVTAGQGSRFPAVPFNAIIWPGGVATPANAEVVRVTAISTDTFTITRAQEGSTARTVLVGDLIAATVTAKTLTDLEAPSSIGYSTGVGGSVTQATNKSTGVTLSTICGRITMNGAALSAAAEVTFTVTNTLVAATDVIVVNHASGGTSGAYLVVISAVAAGSFNITVSNASGGSLSEAIVLQFAVIKAVIT